MKKIHVLSCMLLVYVLVVASTSWAQGEPGGWSWLNPLPQGNSLNGLWGTAANNVYVVGDYGAVLHYDGSAWTVLEDIPTRKDLHGVWGAGPNDIFGVGDNVILHYDGQTWTPMSPPQELGQGASFVLNGVWGTGPRNVYAVGDALGLYGPPALFHYDGDQWSSVTAPAPAGTPAEGMPATFSGQQESDRAEQL